MLAKRRRRWASIGPALGQRVVFSGLTLSLRGPSLCQILTYKDGPRIKTAPALKGLKYL